MLKFDSLSLGSSSRPQTPPNTSSARASPTPPPNRQQYQSPERKPYSNLNSSSLSGWDVIDGPDEGDDDILYDEDEDEFGLPSLESMRKRRMVKEQQATNALGGHSSSSQGLSSAPLPPHMRSSSFDIAEERNPLAYPSTKKGEGKILRPQYKE
ncbi:MAG: GTPase-activating protein, partial [Watsoniomyces obsoletus]